MGPGLIGAGLLVILLAYGYKLTVYDAEREQVHVAGSVAPGFERVQEAFRANLEEGWERGGGAFVVYHKGVKVVDLWGGYSDKESARLWQKDTMNIAFSSTKAVAAVCVAHLVDQGRLAWDDLVSKHWPEFAKNGKENITVRWIMQHRAGLGFTDAPIDFATAMDRRARAKIFEEQAPQWPAGTATGYHAITYGWLVDELVWRTDEKHRSIGQYFKEEIAEKFGLDFHIGLPKSESYRVTRLRGPSVMNFLAEYIHAPANINVKHLLTQYITGGMLMKANQNVPWINFIGGITLNNPDLYAVEQAAVLGIGVTRDLALMFEKLRTGKIISAERLKDLTSDYVKETDLITGATVGRGLGFIVKEIERENGKTYNLYGHAGYGGQNVRIDLDNELSLAYMSNHLKVGLGDTARTYVRLVDVLYDCIEDLNA